MSKRIRLSETGVVGNEGMKQESHLKALVTRPEATRLVQLDRDLRNILQDATLTPEERVRKFEEKLAEFQKTKEKLIDLGGLRVTSVPPKLQAAAIASALNDQVTDIVAHIMKMLSTESGSEEAHEGDVESISSHIPAEPPTLEPLSGTVGSKLTTSGEVGSEEQPQASVETNKQTGHHRRSKSCGDGEAGGSKTTDKVRCLLARHGFEIPESDLNRVVVTRSGQPIRKYTLGTLNEVLDFLFGDQPSDKQPKSTWKHLMNSVYDALKEDASNIFERLIIKHPKLKYLEEERNFPIRGWETITRR